MQWCAEFCSDLVIFDNWNLCIDYLQIFENDELQIFQRNVALEIIGDKLISNLIGVLESDIPLLSPFCFVTIAIKISLLNKAFTMENLLSQLLTYIIASIQACENRSYIEENNQKQKLHRRK
jgi:hypothetical protein